MKLYNKKPISYDKKNQIPIFESQKEGMNEFSITNAGKIHDNALKWLFKTHLIKEDNLRSYLIKKLNLKKKDKVLVTACGTGNDLEYITDCIGKDGTIYAQDFAKEMVFEAFSRIKKNPKTKNSNIEFSVCNALNLPFDNNVFDATFHFGGINLYSNIKEGIDEMDRVTKPGGKIVFGDEGIAYWLKKNDIAKALIANNKLYQLDPPINFLPSTAKDVNLSWVINNCFYVIEYTVGNKTWSANLDIPHVGKRGGSIRKRYYGQLEGVDPDLKNQLYSKAEKKNISRVELLERIIRDEIKKDD